MTGKTIPATMSSSASPTATAANPEPEAFTIPTAALLALGGLLLQAVGFPIIGAMVFAVGLFLWSRPPAGLILDLSPAILGKDRWANATEVEVGRIRAKLKAIEAREGGCLGTLLRVVLFFAGAGLVFGSVLLVMAVADIHLGTADDEVLYVMVGFVIDFLALFGAATQASPNLWKPEVIESKLPPLEEMLALLPQLRIGNWQREFQLRLEKSARGEVPTDIRVVLKPPDCPAKLYGIQAQVTFNRGRPYLYFVVVSHAEFPLEPARSSDSHDVIDRKSEKDVRIVVIRQYADKHGGYNTSASDVARLLRLAIETTRISLRNWAGESPEGA